MSKLVPTGDHIIVETVAEETTSKSGIIIPDTASKERPIKGEVIAVGPGKMTDSGSRLEMEVKVGDIVIFSKYGPNEVKVEGKDYLILSASDVYAKIGK